MAFPSSTGTLASLAEAWTQARQIAAGIKDTATSLRTGSAAGPVGSSQILRMAVYLQEQRIRLLAIRNMPGIGQYVKDQMNNQAMDIATDFNTMITAMDDVINWIVNNFPQSGGFLAAQTIAANGSIVDRQFSTAQTAGIRPPLDALMASIN
jgi:hypothetical protein